jgi:hypothetical protein
LANSELVDAYRQFCQTLRLIGTAVVTCKVEFFSGVVEMNATGKGRAIDIPRLQLLASLVCPDPAQMAGIRRRTFAVEEFEHQRGNFDGHADDPDIARALQIFEDGAASLDCQILRSGRGPGEVLGTLDCLLSTGPGLNWEYGLEVSSFGPEWALVLAYQDAGEDQALAFPWILGFAAQNDFPWSVAAVLAEEPYGTPEPTELSSSGWSGFGHRLLELCWTRGDGGVGFAKDLLELDRNDVRTFIDESDELDYEEILQRLAEARNDIDAFNDDEAHKGVTMPTRDVFHKLVKVRDRM